VALLWATEGDRRRSSDEANFADGWQSRLVETEGQDETDRLVAAENERYLVELRLRQHMDESAEAVLTYAERLIALDPHCVQARCTVADAYLAVGHLAEAAHWYERAGELGTGTGAVAWFRAGQCHLALGDEWAARNAMGRCLELDSTAIEPRQLLTA
jgi:tetratricopeptide (TPR) repeat protein